MSSLVSSRRPAHRRPSGGLVVLLHGLGSDHQDLLPLAEGMDPSIEVVSLRAPYSYGPGFKWFSLDVSNGQVTYDLAEARLSLARVASEVRSIQAEMGRTQAQTVLGGFSQGAMLALGIALTTPDLTDSVWAMSGATIPELRGAVALRTGRLATLVQHGRFDDVVPYQRGLEVRDLLGSIQFCDVDFRTYPMGHSISQQSFQEGAEWVSNRILQSDVSAPQSPTT